MQEDVNSTELNSGEGLSEAEKVQNRIENIMRDCMATHGMIAMLYNRIIDTITHSNKKCATDEDLKSLKWAEKFCLSLLQEMRAHGCTLRFYS